MPGEVVGEAHTAECGAVSLFRGMRPALVPRNNFPNPSPHTGSGAGECQLSPRRSHLSPCVRFTEDNEWTRRCPSTWLPHVKFLLSCCFLRRSGDKIVPYGESFLEAQLLLFPSRQQVTGRYIKGQEPSYGVSELHHRFDITFSINQMSKLSHLIIFQELPLSKRPNYLSGSILGKENSLQILYYDVETRSC